MYCQSPTIVNIGAVFTFNSIIGRVAMVYGGGSATPKRQKKKIKKKRKEKKVGVCPLGMAELPPLAMTILPLGGG